MAKCKKSKGIRKDAKLARFNTLTNKINKLETVCKNRPFDISAQIGLDQAKYDRSKL